MEHSGELEMFSLDSAQIQCPSEAASLASPERHACLSNSSWDSRVTSQASPHPFAGKEASLLAVSLFHAQSGMNRRVQARSRSAGVHRGCTGVRLLSYHKTEQRPPSTCCP